MGTFRIKRIYDAPASTDGKRVLVDRIWPRGVSKESAKLDLWLKEIAPSTGLRKWFDHDPARFEEFSDRYCEELKANSEAVSELCDLADQGDVTLLYAARDSRVNHAVVLAELLEQNDVQSE
ncbi:DUF488 domain-containing protein [Croceicoccus naphthovorans]|uniref:Uncharacterized protein n=1 Tax=Croceicoccus naphthovorans TaxID=1348774 RepID=A0A0G3XCW0_9SPHN|nr:DUF488 domain-containing protein [Croceicoccus naphthovorans]AKM09395.1 hypothetical protein AB433_04385 [Croceicoccus naphthovorans]MBB3990325.1 uncharacterized protein YeaO (DUF488 family) [Croceicoccus naphthovorans]